MQTLSQLTSQGSVSMYHKDSNLIYKRLKKEIGTFSGGTKFKLADIEIDVVGKDGIGGLIEEWFGAWAIARSLNIHNPKTTGNSQTFPDYFVGSEKEKGLLEIKTFNGTASANFDIANFDSYCLSLKEHPKRIDTDYLIFSYKMAGIRLTIDEIWLKKIWQITSPSGRWPLKTQTKRDVIYNIRPASWFGKNPKYKPFADKKAFVDALYSTELMYLKKRNLLKSEVKETPNLAGYWKAAT